VEHGLAVVQSAGEAWATACMRESRQLTDMRVDSGACIVRSWRWGDLRALPRQADSPAVWSGMRDRFPQPYRVRDAVMFLLAVSLARWTGRPERHFAIEVGGEVAGGIGVLLGSDVHARTAELFYWLGESFWGRGIATGAVKAVASHVIAHHRLLRLCALPYSDNSASCRVLEKAGFSREGVLRNSAVKNGRVLDQVVYAIAVEGEEGRGA
jgi:ribosomal-protein-alanine N-acetyltransferase